MEGEFKAVYLPYLLLLTFVISPVLYGLIRDREVRPIPADVHSQKRSPDTDLSVEESASLQADGVSCLLLGSCRSSSQELPGEFALPQSGSGDYSPVKIIGDPRSASKKSNGKMKDLIKKFFGFLRKLKFGGLIDVEFSLLDDVNITVIYAPVAGPDGGGGEVVPVAMMRFSKVIYFSFDSFELHDKIGVDILQEFVSHLASGGLEQNQVSIVGHADNVGEPGYNRRLSLDRAKGVETVVLRQADLADVPVFSKAIGVGETQPVQQFTTATRSQLNRRVEFFFSTSAAANETAVEYVDCLHRNRDNPAKCFDEFLRL